MNAIPSSEAFDREARLIHLLDKPGVPATAVALMRGINLEFEQAGGDIWAPVIPPTAYVTFLNVALRANALLKDLGFVLVRSGGRPSDRYWIEPQGGSPASEELSSPARR